MTSPMEKKEGEGSLPTRERGLKLAALRLVLNDRTSLPTRERGLKLFLGMVILTLI